jgi:large subunit ribosomal protein L32
MAGGWNWSHITLSRGFCRFGVFRLTCLTPFVNFATIRTFFYLFMPLPSFRSSRSKVRRRRSHHALKITGSVTCTNCGAPVLAHRACKACGFYKGRNVRGASVTQADKVIAKATKKSAAAKPVVAEDEKKPAVKRAAKKPVQKAEVSEE